MAGAVLLLGGTVLLVAFWVGPFYFLGGTLLLALGWGRSTFCLGRTCFWLEPFYFWLGPFFVGGLLFEASPAFRDLRGAPGRPLELQRGRGFGPFFFRSCGQPPHEPSGGKETVKALMMPKLKGGGGGASARNERPAVRAALHAKHIASRPTSMRSLYGSNGTCTVPLEPS